MKPISGWTFLITGLVVILFSWYIISKTGEPLKLILFIIIGIGFIFTGIAKLFKRREDKPSHSRHVPKHQNTPAQHTAPVHHTSPHHKTTHSTQNHPHCPYCGSIVNHNGNYCISCGNKIR